jgi:hypothetical protein
MGDSKMTMNELMKSKRISLLHSSGYQSRVNANTPSVVHVYKVVYTRVNGDEIVIATAKHNRKDFARKTALNLALDWANS